MSPGRDFFDFSSRCQGLISGLKMKKSRCALHGLESRANYRVVLD